MLEKGSSDCLTVDDCSTPASGSRCLSCSSNSPVPKASSENMYLWAGEKGEGKSDSKSFYQRLKELEVLDKKKRTVTALRAGEDRAVLLGLSLVLFSAMTYFVMGITVLRSSSDSPWTEEVSCSVLNVSLLSDVLCSYDCGAECRGTSRYPCLQVFVSVTRNSSTRAFRLLHNEDTYVDNPECLLVPKCRKDYPLTRELVVDMYHRLRAVQSVRCFVDPNERTDLAILTQVYSRGALFHSLFWPTLGLVGGVVLIAMVKLTQYLSLLCEGLSRTKT